MHAYILAFCILPLEASLKMEAWIFILQDFKNVSFNMSVLSVF